MSPQNWLILDPPPPLVTGMSPAEVHPLPPLVTGANGDINSREYEFVRLLLEE